MLHIVVCIKQVPDSREIRIDPKNNTLIRQGVPSIVNFYDMHGLEEALRRADAYAKAGADILFVESPESEGEMEKICANSELPQMANMVEGGRTPVLSAQRLEQLGYKIAIFPATGFLAAGAVLESVYQTLKRDGSSVKVTAPLHEFSAFTRLMGFEQVWEFDQRHAD